MARTSKTIRMRVLEHRRTKLTASRLAAQAVNRTKAMELQPNLFRPDAFAAIVNGLTAHERQLWASAGYPGAGRDRNPEGPRAYSSKVAAEALRTLLAARAGI